ncbi:hypothetical protein PS420_09240, partial [Pediococcus acidilactici]
KNPDCLGNVVPENLDFLNIQFITISDRSYSNIAATLIKVWLLFYISKNFLSNNTLEYPF